MRAFGIGNFEFNLTRHIEGLTVFDFISELKKKLASIHNIESIEIDYDQNDNDRLIVFEAPTGLRSNDGYNPRVSFLDLWFDLYIPYRVQETFLTELGFQRMAEPQIEHFRVNIKDHFYSMVTHVEMLGSTRDSEPSNGIFIVREYLKKYFNSLGSFIKFHAIGPSPFHANFYVIEQPKKSDAHIEINFVEKHGYNDVEIFTTSDEIVPLDFIYYDMQNELDFFYYLIDIKNEFMHEWYDISNKLNELMNLDSSRLKFTNHMKRKRLISDILKLLWMFKARVVAVSSRISMKYNDVYSVNKSCFYIQDFVDREISIKHDYPIDDTKELVKFYEEKNSKSLELIINFTTALLGALVGVFFAK
ncbi:hypothetical protein [Serratia marcescens]|uniref:hypothetical protein n=1 Tax=Serratia marcescens TaxID=615 RepID=UPI003EE3A7B1